ncbi:MAG: endonuclease III [Bacteroidales bacterium]|nr:endonuclease III [Bacteroidales bacterium]HOY39353.1 endonuclease III [Bacteroidales bacterium]HQP03810.1 endonuclease III [Bacteroidales bacterium]
MTKKERYQGVISWFSNNIPVAETELHYTNPYQLIVAVILSAQCTDKRVNIITPAFFKHFPTVYSLSEAKIDEIYELIKSCSYPNNKTNHLKRMAETLVNDFNGIVPSDTAELIKLPGVGRKTANVIASVAFNQPKMAVDTHVFRVSNRLGLTRNAKTPLAVETELVKHFPESLIGKAHHWLILHGRYVCKARKPQCESCGISLYCKFFEHLQKNVNN